MKIDFSILWIDDNREFVDSLRAPLEKWMDSHGFQLTIHDRKSEVGIYDDLKKQIIELIVVDFKLPRKKGDDLIREMRAKQYYQDIVFYSMGGIPSEVLAGHLEGVFVVDRTDAKERITDLLELRIRRASDLATLRGWVVADSIELERQLDDVLSKCFQKHEQMFTVRVLNHEGLFDFYKKHSVLAGIIKDTAAELEKRDARSTRLATLRKCQNTLKEFPDEIIHVRNSLAHQLEEVVEGGATTLKTRAKGKVIKFAPETCVSMRKNIQKHRENLSSLHGWLCEL